MLGMAQYLLAKTVCVTNYIRSREDVEWLCVVMSGDKRSHIFGDFWFCIVGAGLTRSGIF